MRASEHSQLRASTASRSVPSEKHGPSWTGSPRGHAGKSPSSRNASRYSPRAFKREQWLQSGLPPVPETRFRASMLFPSVHRELLWCTEDSRACHGDFFGIAASLPGEGVASPTSRGAESVRPGERELGSSPLPHRAGRVRLEFGNATTPCQSDFSSTSSIQPGILSFPEIHHPISGAALPHSSSKHDDPDQRAAHTTRAHRNTGCGQRSGIFPLPNFR